MHVCVKSEVEAECLLYGPPPCLSRQALTEPRACCLSSVAAQGLRARLSPFSLPATAGVTEALCVPRLDMVVYPLADSTDLYLLPSAMLLPPDTSWTHQSKDLAYLKSQMPLKPLLTPLRSSTGF